MDYNRILEGQDSEADIPFGINISGSGWQNINTSGDGEANLKAILDKVSVQDESGNKLVSGTDLIDTSKALTEEYVQAVIAENSASAIRFGPGEWYIVYNNIKKGGYATGVSNSGKGITRGVDMNLKVPAGTLEAGKTYKIVFESGIESGVGSSAANASTKTVVFEFKTKSVNVPVTSVTVTPSGKTLTVGKTVTLSVVVAPQNATNKEVSWTSSNSSIASVDENGTVTAISPGTAVITATAGGENEVNGRAIITVEKKEILEGTEPLNQAPVLMAKSVYRTKTSNTITWTKVKGASGYYIYNARCNHSGKVCKLKRVKTIKNNKTRKCVVRNLKKGKNYKFKVATYAVVNGKKKVIATSYIGHYIANKSSARATNPKKITAVSKKITLKTGKTKKATVKIKKTAASKSLLSPSHVKRVRYKTSDSTVAVVNKNGKITAKKAGTCNVYAVAANGRWADTGNRKITNEPKRSDRYERTKQKTHCTAVSDTAWRAVLHLAAVAGNCPGGG